MGEGTDAAKPSVLIVEDDPILSMDLAELLEEWNYTVCGVAGSAEKAMRLARQHKPRLALVDVGLSGAVDGVDLAVRLRRELSVPSIILTGAFSTELAQRALSAQPAGFLSKPYMPADLERALSEACRQSAQAPT